ncbi:type II secretion system protein GspG [Carboxylicivirga marina]|uniref:type II secretion system protein GspG n=1 Tax=Carboxylicivirga marina TaxID=2800988 RepID=UPI00259887AC|nr:type II secretion system protein GspG [uncultured Carboxylicivirga sp.]
MIGIILSIIFPGLGQVYFKKNGKGILMMILAIIPFIYPFILIWSIIDCIYLNKKINKQDRLSLKETVIGIGIFFVVVPLVIYALFLGLFKLQDNLTDNYFNPKNTRRELKEIKVELDKYYNYHETYPTNYTDFVNSKPIWANWETDSWQNKYNYILINSESFKLVSLGRDEILGTDDDIEISNENE